MEVPREERIQLQQTSAVYLKGLQICPVAPLRGATASNDGLYTQLLVCATSWLNLNTVSEIARQ
jgi:hypothetical protein